MTISVIITDRLRYDNEGFADRENYINFTRSRIGTINPSAIEEIIDRTATCVGIAFAGTVLTPKRLLPVLEGSDDTSILLLCASGRSSLPNGQTELFLMKCQPLICRVEIRVPE